MITQTPVIIFGNYDPDANYPHYNGRPIVQNGNRNKRLTANNNTNDNLCYKLNKVIIFNTLASLSN